MRGAVVGDCVGSRFEFNNLKSRRFDWLHEDCEFTDDSVCTVAVADILLNDAPPVATLQRWCRAFPDAGYGGMFREWVRSDTPAPYKSFGNGAAMRVSPAALLHRDSLEDALAAAERVTEITHNHEEGLKGARATTRAIWLALHDTAPDEIRAAVTAHEGYCLKRSVDEIRPDYKFNETCQETVPEALTCALEAHDFESAIRNAISIGGDSDTVAAIAGSVAEALFGLDEKAWREMFAQVQLPQTMQDVLTALYERADLRAQPR